MNRSAYRIVLGTVLGLLVLAGPLHTVARAYTYVRKEINSLSPTEIADLRAVFKALQDRVATNPESFRFQANIHGTTDTPADPLWNQCAHGTEAFLAWHRAYLLYFEQILRQVSGQADFALPYWDWTAHPTLPEAFRTPADASNPLWIAGRNAAIAAGGEISDDIVDVTGDMARTTFFTTADGVGFQPDIEGTPHGAVHVTIGGQMGSVPTAANDPIFWLHHCNIDRLWSRWLAQGGGRRNPSTTSSLGLTSWKFPDAYGAVVTIEGRDVFCLDRLGYRYDDHDPPSCLLRVIAIDWLRLRSRIVKVLGPIAVRDTVARAAFRFRTRSDVEPFRPLFAPTRTNTRLELRLQDIRFPRLPDGPYMVFLNAPRGARLDHRSRSFVGHLHFFGGTAHADSAHGGTFSQSFDITDQIRAIGGLDRLRRDGIQVTLRKTGVKPPRGQAFRLRADTLDIGSAEIHEVDVPASEE